MGTLGTPGSVGNALTTELFACDASDHGGVPTFGDVPTNNYIPTCGDGGSPCAGDASGRGYGLTCTVDDDDPTRGGVPTFGGDPTRGVCGSPCAGDASGHGDDIICTVDDDDSTFGGDPTRGDGGPLATAMPRATATLLLVPSTTTILHSPAMPRTAR